MPVDILEHLAYLPCQQTLFAVVFRPFHGLWIKLSAQQRGGLAYRAMRGLFLVKMTNRRVQQCYYGVHPVTRSGVTDFLTRLDLVYLSLHAAAPDGGPIPTLEEDVDRALQWEKSPSIEGLPGNI